MSEKWPKFKIWAVIDGNSSGLLVEKQTSKEALPERVYFYLKGGLKPTEEILRACSGRVYFLHTENYHERRLFKELISYAVAADKTGEMGAIRVTTEKHHEDKGYQDTVNRYFEKARGYAQEFPFKEFFVSAPIFKAQVLKNIRGEHRKVKGMAEEFGVLSPHQITSNGFKLIEPIQNILKIGSEEEATWFRKSGPIAADFEDGRIYRRKDLFVRLKKLVLSNSTSMLEGIAATGKTVLMRDVAYELFRKDNLAVYYFDCDLKRDFDIYKLVEDINNTKGIVILENIHLETRKFQCVYGRIKQDQYRHILFVARPSFRDGLYSRLKDLGSIDSLKLEPFDEVDKVINHFASYYRELYWSTEVYDSIKKTSGKSYWLISYALKGYATMGGEVEPVSWCEKGVKQDLNDLKNINSVFPEVLVTLSPLYQSEVLTEESYLTRNLKFDYEVLDELVQRGEVTYQKTEDGFVLYGLPHSALADVYWEHGKEYRTRRGLKEYKDFVYDYAKSNVSNGLQAAIAAEIRFRTGKTANVDGNDLFKKARDNDWRGIVVRLDGEGLLQNVIKKERSLEAINAYLSLSNDAQTLNPDILPIIAEKMNESDDSSYPIRCLSSIYSFDKEFARGFWELLDHRKLRKMQIGMESQFFITSSINFIYCFDVQLARSVCETLDPEQLATSLNEAWDVQQIGQAIFYIMQAHKECGQELWSLLDKEALASKLITAQPIWTTERCIYYILLANREMASELCGLLDVKELASRLDQFDIYGEIGKCLCTIWESDPKRGEALWQCLDKPSLAAKLSVSPYFWSGTETCIYYISRADEKIASELCELLELEQLGRVVSGYEDVSIAGECISRIVKANREKGWKFWRLLDKKRLAFNISQEEDLWYRAECIQQVYRGDPAMAKELCNLLDKSEFVKRLVEIKELENRNSFLEVIKKANEKMHQEILKLLGEEKE
jgi:hypothetical protein